VASRILGTRVTLVRHPKKQAPFSVNHTLIYKGQRAGRYGKNAQQKRSRDIIRDIISEMSEAAEKPAQIGELNSDDIELLHATAGAIQRLLAERNALLTRIDALERELHQTTLVHECYRKITTEFVTQFQLIDRAVGDLFREPIESAGARTAQQQPAEAESIQFPSAVA
jgi:hypothetical protein